MEELPTTHLFSLHEQKNRNILLNVREIAVVRSFERGNRFDLWIDPLLVEALKVLDAIVEGREQHGHNDPLQGNACLSLARHPTEHQT